MELTPLKTFLTLAKVGHMTRSARLLHLTQPAVSAQLARLEEELGHRLFDRTPKGMNLTEAGRLFHAYAEEVVGRLDDGKRALDALAGLEQGSLAIGGGATATTYLLPPLLGQFHHLYPAIRLFLREQGSQSVLEGVAAGQLDIGLVTLPISTALAGSSVKLEVEPWVDDELRLILPPAHPLNSRKSIHWTDLDETPCVLFEDGSAVRDLINRHQEEAGVQLQTVMELRSIESIKQMVAQGIGAGFVSQYALSGPEAGHRVQDAPILRQLGLLYRSDRTLSKAATVFLELARAWQRDG